ncbi:hypothetical protein SAMN05421812_10359 [Asanoa hainanensis]|uniref:Uncharacterized protein n=1 Tax=Asanoa hainanensis TaxID=560556 RepID=A0A239JPE9_9ACTN|nr:hypothetical protein SAMN05421812_10359 [Asanoa hainanensis]
MAALVDTSDVRIRRRDGATLLLTREDRMDGAAEGAIAAARTLRGVLAQLAPDQALEVLSEEFPWLALLPETDATLFVRDFGKAAQISAELGQWTVLAQALREWKATAAVYANPTLADDLTHPLNERPDPKT